MSQGKRPYKSIYAVYSKNDELICVGNIKECCHCLGVAESTFYVTMYKDKNGMRKKVYRYKIVRLEENEYEKFERNVYATY